MPCKNHTVNGSEHNDHSNNEKNELMVRLALKPQVLGEVTEKSRETRKKPETSQTPNKKTRQAEP